MRVPSIVYFGCAGWIVGISLPFVMIGLLIAMGGERGRSPDISPWAVFGPLTVGLLIWLNWDWIRWRVLSQIRRRFLSHKNRLEEIPGIGPRRRRALMRCFGSLSAIRDASPEQLAAVEGLTPALATSAHAFLNLEKIPGIGPRRRLALIKCFGSMSAIRDASLEQLAAVEGLTPAIATSLHAFLNSPAAGPSGIQLWIDRYRSDHIHPLNHLTHFIGIPAIVMSPVVVFFDWPWGVGLFVGGWILQFVGHGIEGNKPSFMKDPRFLLIGPLFIIQEGFRKLTGKSTPPAKD